MPNYQNVQFMGYMPDTSLLDIEDTNPMPTGKQQTFEWRINQIRSLLVEILSFSDPSDSTLKVVMLPESFFRLVNDIYQVEDVSMISQALRALTQSAQFQHFLFIFGTIMAGIGRNFNTHQQGVEPNLYEILNVCLVQKGGRPPLQTGENDDDSLVIYKDYVAEDDYPFESQFSERRNFIMSNNRATINGLPSRILPTEGAAVTNAYQIAYLSPAAFNSVTVLIKRILYLTVQQDRLFAKAKDAFDRDQNTSVLLSELDQELNQWVSQNVPGTGPQMSLNIYKKIMQLFAERMRIVSILPTRNLYNEFSAGQPGSNLLGASYFTKDNIGFGVEVCADHAEGRLRSAVEANLARSNQVPPIHIQLIPSCGMDIRPGSVAVVDGGYVFNVDGIFFKKHVTLKVRRAAQLVEIAPIHTNNNLCVFPPQPLPLSRVAAVSM